MEKALPRDLNCTYLDGNQIFQPFASNPPMAVHFVCVLPCPIQMHCDKQGPWRLVRHPRHLQWTHRYGVTNGANGFSLSFPKTIWTTRASTSFKTIHWSLKLSCLHPDSVHSPKWYWFCKFLSTRIQILIGHTKCGQARNAVVWEPNWCRISQNLPQATYNLARLWVWWVECIKMLSLDGDN